MKSFSDVFTDPIVYPAEILDKTIIVTGYEQLYNDGISLYIKATLQGKRILVATAAMAVTYKICKAKDLFPLVGKFIRKNNVKQSYDII